MSNATRIENYYEILGVTSTATPPEIKKAYRALSLRYHPDRLETKPASEKAAAEARFKEINEAYENLSDPTKREAYDIRMGFKVVVPDTPFDHFAWDQWVNGCIATGNISALHDFILDSKQPQNIRRHVSIHLFNHYYVSQRYDVLCTLAKNPTLSFVKKEALVGIVKGYVKQVRKGVSIPFSDDSSTVSSRWSVIGNPFEQFDRDSMEYASREAVAYLFTTRRSTPAAKMVDYDSLHTIGQVESFLLLEFIEDPVDNALVKVVTSEMRVTIGRADFYRVFGYFEDRDIERPTTEVIDGDLFIFLLVEAIGERSSRRFVDDTTDIEASDFSRFLGRFALRVIEVGRDRDDGIGDFLSELFLSIGLELGQDHGAYLLWAVLLATHDNLDAFTGLNHLVRQGLHVTLSIFVAKVSSDETLDGEQRVLWVGDRLTLGEEPHQTLTSL
jgi:hypothetical protein